MAGVALAARRPAEVPVGVKGFCGLFLIRGIEC